MLADLERMPVDPERKLVLLERSKLVLLERTSLHPERTPVQTAHLHRMRRRTHHLRRRTTQLTKSLDLRSPTDLDLLLMAERRREMTRVLVTEYVKHPLSLDTTSFHHFMTFILIVCLKNQNSNSLQLRSSQAQSLPPRSPFF
jgi:hypothetical protein